MNNKYIFIIAGASLLLVAGGAYLWYGYQPQQEPFVQQNQENVPGQQKEEQEPSSNGIAATSVIIYTDAGYAPRAHTITAGDTVTFVNQSSGLMWTASAMHPTHTAYPGSSIAKCGTSQEQGIFDACKGVEANGEWSFTFGEKGTWNYHDHLSPTRFGTIIVE